jgi:hypothetical protein
MKSKAFCGFLAVLVLFLCSGLAYAQQAKNQMYLVYDCVTNPSTDAKFYEALKEMLAFYTKYAFPYTWDVYGTGDYHYYYRIPVAGFADIEKFLKTDEEIMTKQAAEYQALTAKFEGTYEFSEFQVYTFRPDLSYVAANPYYKPEETSYVAFDIWSFFPGKEMEAEKLIKEFLATCQKKGVRDSWYCYSGVMGVELGTYLMAGPDKSEAEFLNHNLEMWKLLGKDVEDIYNKLLAICRKREYKRAWYQPELSYSPKK